MKTGMEHPTQNIEQREPAEILRVAATKKLATLFPESVDQIDDIIDSFLMDILSEKKIPALLYHMSPERQKELLLSTGADSIDKAIEIILSEISEPLIAFYGKRISTPAKKSVDFYED